MQLREDSQLTFVEVPESVRYLRWESSCPRPVWSCLPPHKHWTLLKAAFLMSARFPCICAQHRRSKACGWDIMFASLDSHVSHRNLALPPKPLETISSSHCHTRVTPK